MQTIESKKLITQITKDCICPYTLKFIGIDVSKNKLDVYETKNNQYFTLANDKEGIHSSFSKIKRNQQQLVLIDLTGGYEAEVVKEFTVCGYNVHSRKGVK
ncbi:hypothetical protein AGMMS50222_10100 [Endomicrobiia bacterium]|nr:hypothetical protein AGMMS50222_10100 [Endomicrobiia bacterium]